MTQERRNFQCKLKTILVSLGMLVGYGWKTSAYVPFFFHKQTGKMSQSGQGPVGWHLRLVSSPTLQGSTLGSHSSTAKPCGWNVTAIPHSCFSQSLSEGGLWEQDCYLISSSPFSEAAFSYSRITRTGYS